MASKISNEHEKIAEQLHSISIHLLRKLRREDNSSGLNAPRLSALSVIVFGGRVALGELAAAEQVRPPTMTRIVNALERQSLVSRQKISGDARRTYLSPTPAGRRLLIAARERRVRTFANQIKRLNKDQLVTLQAVAEVLKEVIDQM
jgi:DNA-binding MarR family transcriptional regulator